MSEENIKLKEAKATGENSVAADPVVPAGGTDKKRPADLNKKVDPTVDEIEDDVKTPQGNHDVGMKKALESLFDGESLSEDFINKTTTIFEAAVNERVETIREELEAKFDAQLEEQVKAVVSDLTESVDSYLDYVVEKWMEENEVAIEAGIKVETAESLMANIKKLMAEHNLEIEEDNRDVVSEMEKRVEVAESKYNEAVSKLLALEEANENMARAAIFEDVAEGLAETQVERLRDLSENLSYGDLEQFETKLKTIKEGFFTEVKAPAVDETEYLEEEVADKSVKSPYENISAYVNTLSKYSAKN